MILSTQRPQGSPSRCTERVLVDETTLRRCRRTQRPQVRRQVRGQEDEEDHEEVHLLLQGEGHEQDVHELVDELVHLLHDLLHDLEGPERNVHLLHDLADDLLLVDGVIVGAPARTDLWPLGTPASS